MVTPLLSTPRISMMDLRKELGTVLDKVDYRSESLVITRGSKVKGVLVPLREFEQMQQLRQQVKAGFFAVVDAIQARTAQHDPEQVQAAVDEAVEAVLGKE